MSRMRRTAKDALYGYSSSDKDEYVTPVDRRPDRDEYVTKPGKYVGEVEEEDKEEKKESRAGDIAWVIANGLAQYGKEQKKYQDRLESWRRRFSSK